jgi:hypothetical protein
VRLLEIAGVLVLLGGGLVLIRALWVREPKPAAEWEPFHRFKDGRRRVYVRRDDELEPVGQVASDDPDYDATFLRLMDAARERAAMLNSER